MAILIIPFLLCAAFVLSGAVETTMESAEVQQQDLPLGQMDEDGNPPSLLDTEEELKSDELEELGEEEEMAEAQRCARKRPSGWARYGKRIYLYVSQRKQWVDAERYCLRLKGNLASVHSLGQQNFLRRLVKSRTGSYPWTWIGGTDNVRNRVWLWSDGSRFDFQYWAKREPNNHGRREPCININFDGKGAWNDLYCHASLGFICSK
ncbi:ladderlectin-like isoform X2 [Hypomesus transpacificus]|uniref:ladderlectin-like isoform X2 n=1 Tax=Hypomesus transpacificus TaxID=137520 RepID=UPI001F088017|nr:ladderlectin-like isoform X2 [Hypomesus transpacificus]